MNITDDLLIAIPVIVFLAGEALLTLAPRWKVFFTWILDEPEESQWQSNISHGCKHSLHAAPLNQSAI